jgi:tetratricopeptide (TPR) repeat protein
MRFCKPTLTAGWILLSAFCAQAAYQVEVRFTNGTFRKVNALTVESGSVVLSSENLTVPLAQVKEAVFAFDGLTEADCTQLVKIGAYDDLAARLKTALDEVPQAMQLPGNIDGYLLHNLRASFWTGNYAEAQRMIGILQTKASPAAPLAALYGVLIQIERGETDAAVKSFEAVTGSDSALAPAVEFVRARLAMARREYEPALEGLATVLAQYGRDLEWLPAATLYEGIVYKRTGYPELASVVAKELRLAWPGAYWERRAGELK